jgi:lambda repressor-like predicted transcriptional regulator
MTSDIKNNLRNGFPLRSHSEQGGIGENSLKPVKRGDKIPLTALE